jgi:hypothetical protein
MRWITPALIAASVAACSGEDVSVSELSSASNAINIVDVSLVEFSVTVAEPTAPAGRIRFRVHNDGDVELHEFVVVKTELAIAELPTNPDGSFNEEGEGVEVLDEIEDIPAHATRGLTLTLAAGHYVLLCNRVEVEEDGEVESHFAEGMRTDFNAL